MTRVYMVKAYHKYDDDTEIVGIADSLEKADLMVRDYIDKIYCYGTARFDVTWWNLNEHWGEGAHERFYTCEEVIRIAEELGKIKGHKDPVGAKGCICGCPNCMEVAKVKWTPETDTCTCLSCGWTNAEDK